MFDYFLNFRSEVTPYADVESLGHTSTSQTHKNMAPIKKTWKHMHHYLGVDQ